MKTLTKAWSIEFPDGRSEIYLVIGPTRYTIAVRKGQSKREIARMFRILANEMEAGVDA